MANNPQAAPPPSNLQNYPPAAGWQPPPGGYPSYDPRANPQSMPQPLAGVSPYAFPGWVNSLPTDILPMTGALYVGAPGAQVLLGRTVGGIDWDPGRAIEDVKYDGLRAGVRGLQWGTDFKSIIKTKLITFSGNSIPTYEPGVVSASGSGSVATYWQAFPASTLFSPGAYINDLSAIWKRTDGSLFRVRLHIAICMKYKLTSKDKMPVEVDTEFHGNVDPTVVNPATGVLYTTDDAPYILEALPSGATP
jgi:hypothetical protein